MKPNRKMEDKKFELQRQIRLSSAALGSMQSRVIEELRNEKGDAMKLLKIWEPVRAKFQKDIDNLFEKYDSLST